MLDLMTFRSDGEDMNSSTPKNVITIVVVSLAAICLAALAGTIFLIQDHSDPSLIGLVSSQGGMALGGLTGVLVSTRTTEAVNASSRPLPPVAK